MKVNEVMNKKVITCHPEEKVSAILNKLKLLNISGMPVVLKGRLMGLISRTDILNYLSMGMEVEKIDKKELLIKYNTYTEEIMIKEVITVDPSFTVEEAAKVMVEHDINMLPVIQEDQVVGILTRGDIVKALAEECM
ncbi:MAG: CBS domain-containing protein [Deltaproteobacteria bacterium]|nr:CBS domain-containing protein [Deltaproteobacteria bacterium]